MPYPDDDADHDDRARDERDAGSRRRASGPARPAWDAATYGTPDDMRRARSQARPRYEEPPPYEDPPPARYEDPPLPRYDDPPRYPEPDPYAYAADPYPAAADPYPSDRYPPDPYPSDPYPSDPYPSDPYPPYEAPAPYERPPYETPPYEAPPPYAGPTFPPYEPPPFALDDEPRTEAAYPGGLDGATPGSRPARGAGASRSGRNLPAAIGVGVLLGAVVAASLFLWRPAFFAVVAVAVGIGIWELVRAIRSTGVNPPLIPLVAGGALMTGLAWWGHADALTFGLIVTVLAAMVWRLADGAGGYGRDVTAATMVAVYVPFLAGFAALLATPADGDLRVVVTLAGVVLSDTGGYIAGVLAGKHPMAPSVSPKKSWEGLAGSLLAAAIGGAIMLALAFDVAIWLGALFGLAVSAASVLGDLGESMIKRDLGVKDMSNLLPGHGGLMDRLDSIIFAAPTGYLLLVLMAPPT